MKSVLVSLSSLLLGALVSTAAPEKIAFGQELLLQSLAQATRAELSVSGEGIKISTVNPFTFSPVDSTEELGAIIKGKQVPFVMSDPRKQINTKGIIKNSAGDVLFESTGSFKMVKRKKKYVIPESSGIIYFTLATRKVYIDGVKSASVTNVDGDTVTLGGRGGWIIIPSYIGSNPDYWNTMQITFTDNSVVKYDKHGDRISEQSATLVARTSVIDGIYSKKIDNSYLTLELGPQDGWNPIIEVTVTETQTITLDVTDWNGWLRPTHVRICTLDDIRSGVDPEAIPYSPEETGEHIETIDVTLKPGTHYLRFEWSVWIDDWSDSGGKG